MKLRVLSILLMALVAAACGAGAGTPTPLPTVVLGGGSTTPQASSPGLSGGVTASGIVVPAQETRLAFASGGRVDMLPVAVGDQVQAGQVLARLAGGETL